MCVAVRCVPWCVVLPPLVCLPAAPLSGALSWCCAPRVLVMPPFPHASLARLLATPLSLSLLRRSLSFPLLSVGLPSSLVCTLFPASALVFVLVFLLAYFLGPGSRVLFFLSCSVL